MKHSILLALLFAVSSAFAISVLEPISAQVQDGSEILIGDVGPGQTFAVSVSSKVATGGRYGTGGAYDQLSATALPEGWTSTPSPLYADPLQVKITVPRDAPDGTYDVTLSLWDEAGQRGLGDDLAFTVKVKVTRDVMDMRVDPPFLTVGANQPARYSITILNKGIASETFTLGSAGVRDWTFQRSIFVPYGTSKVVSYEVVGAEESGYQVNIWSRASSSDLIAEQQDVALEVRSDLFSDYKAVNRGVLLFPLTEAPVYFVVGLLSNLLP